MIVGLAWRTANGGWWRREDGSIATTQLGTLDRGACRSAEDLDLQVADAKPILGRLQEIVVSEPANNCSGATKKSESQGQVQFSPFE